MLTRVIIAGFGGQGVISLGKLLGEVATLEDKYVTYLPSYGPEMRGGTAHCMVCISDKAVASPLFSEPDVAVLFSEPAFEKFAPATSADGLIVANSSLISPKVISQCQHAAKMESAALTDIAHELGSNKVANVVGLSLLLSKYPLVKTTTVAKIIKERFPDNGSLYELNLKALHYFR